MTVKSCKFVEAKDLFRDCPLAWDLFADSDPGCTWGDNARSLVIPSVVTNALLDARLSDEAVGQEVKEVLQRLTTVGENTYIDLEN